MEGWIPLVVFLSVIVVAFILLKLMRIMTFSAVAMASFAGAACLVVLSQYKVTGCQYELSLYNTAETVLILCSTGLVFVYFFYQVFRDNKHQRCCHRCRQKQDLYAPVEQDIVEYEPPEEQQGLNV